MGELIPTFFVLCIGAVAAASWARRFTTREQQLIMASLGAHALAACAQVWITRDYYGIGDMLLYHETGVELARLIRFDPGRFLPEVASLLYHERPYLPVFVLGAGGSSGVPSAVAGLLATVLNDSLYASCMALSFATFFSKGGLYLVLRDALPEEARVRVLIACFLAPSVVFWSSGILKETIAMVGFGWFVFGWYRFLRGKPVSGLMIVALSSLPIAIVKPYILFALFLGAAVWWYWERALSASGGRAVVIRPVYLALGSALALGGILAVGELFPRYALDNLGEEASRLQAIGSMQAGGSDYQIADAPARSLLGQMAFAPLALATSLFRPLIFEVRNAPMLLNAVESTVLTYLFVATVLRRSWDAVWREVRSSPALMFSLTFVLVFGVAVGLASTNMGTLSRYRIPLVPLFGAFVLVLSRARAGAPEITPSSSPARLT